MLDEHLVSPRSSSASMPPHNYYHPPPPPQHQQHHHHHHHHNPYRDAPPDPHPSSSSAAAASSHHAHPSHTPLLPPIQNFDANANAIMQPQPPQQHFSHHHHLPAPPAYPHPQYHYQTGVPVPSMSSSAAAPNGHNPAMMRYALPVQPGMPPVGSRKKDIKRRTKTGCLTCRKRRIKCDEAHPTCRNCVKSNRVCLGYDPIFKSTPGPALLQPAPSANSTGSLKSESSPRPSPAYQQPPLGYPGVAYRNHPQSLDGGHVEYPGASLDPALDSRSPRPILNMAANGYTMLSERQVKHIDMEQLFSINGVPPRFQERVRAAVSNDEVDEFYRLHYASGLDKLFETTWYSERGVQHVLDDSSLYALIITVIDQMRARIEPAEIVSLEARLVWQLAAMPRSANSTNGSTSHDDATKELRARVDTVEMLLTGQYLPPDRILPPPTSQYPQDNQKQIQQIFWHHLSSVTAIRDDTQDPQAIRDINESLLSMRAILSVLESRDVLYSFAIARHIGGRILEWQPPRVMVPLTDDPYDDARKLEVAQKFVASEDQKGTTQVVQRFCGMAMRGWMLLKQGQQQPEQQR